MWLCYQNPGTLWLDTDCSGNFNFLIFMEWKAYLDVKQTIRCRNWSSWVSLSLGHDSSALLYLDSWKFWAVGAFLALWKLISVSDCLYLRSFFFFFNEKWAKSQHKICSLALGYLQRTRLLPLIEEPEWVGHRYKILGRVQMARSRGVQG